VGGEERIGWTENDARNGGSPSGVHCGKERDGPPNIVEKGRCLNGLEEQSRAEKKRSGKAGNGF